MSDYKITVYADPDPESPVGHFFVSVSGPGMEPTTLGRYSKGDKIDFFLSDNPADVRDDSERAQKHGVVSKEIPASKQQAEDAANFLTSAQKNPGKYELWDRNCVDLVQDTLDAGKTGKRVDLVFGKGEIDGMGKLGKFGLGAGQDVIRKGRQMELQEQDPHSIENNYTGPQANDATAQDDIEQAALPDNGSNDGDIGEPSTDAGDGVGAGEAGEAGAGTPQSLSADAEALRGRVRNFGHDAARNDAASGQVAGLVFDGEDHQKSDIDDLLLKPA
ncbi:MAG: hypothetical protein O2944_08715, partial [Proteobacteria bacterium]|nr:hypothetical protein [Pseudomonadota bacterium]